MNWPSSPVRMTTRIRHGSSGVGVTGAGAGAGVTGLAHVNGRAGFGAGAARSGPNPLCHAMSATKSVGRP
ncbi:hypothetical protein SAMN05428945_5316 [Streptomyces sp. 2224.1]|nr:hypothetical protein BX261_0034 [Streptomyces sp. 2321.6]SDR59711.1 hypothetical protein SAMN05216511_7193 [Streptomyces sp. KS_16]SEB66647.1 hypothetical protein SAMN05428940_0034 [Streptomyces sp. 2133.1]SED57153.1 hypothetical protein SAMN05428945_5316 [Streptomyces sp. 2224.1]SEF18221.1 hypothetical protein SAMN05428954_7263 [Streptomyces sp. 2112.3]SNC59370.1 hypothetical protein SAMN06272741_0037 [Streptomyces sp. 2114.4]